MGGEVGIILSKFYKNMKIEKLYDMFYEGNDFGIKRIRIKLEKILSIIICEKICFLFFCICVFEYVCFGIGVVVGCKLFKVDFG